MMGLQILLPTQSDESQVDYNDIHLNVFDTQEQKRAKLEMFIAKSLASVLADHYPNRNWNVGVDLNGGVVIVQCPDVSTVAGYHIKLSRSMNQIRRMLPKIGGEILERAGVPRDRKYDAEHMDLLKRDIRGNVDNSDIVTPEESYAKKQRRH